MSKAKVVSVFNNKGGVGKSTICWNVADALGTKGKNILLIDFDPQCNLSIALLGEGKFMRILPQQNTPYGTTIRAFLQRFLQNTGGEEIFLHEGDETDGNVKLIAGDFWLNVYADSLNVGADLLSGTGLSRYLVLQEIIDKAEEKNGSPFDFVLIDLPPSFGALVRAAFYSSDYYIVPCTSDSFSVYCVGLIGQMVPSFVRDWTIGLDRFKQSNPHFDKFDDSGKPVFAGWVFNGFDTARQRRSIDAIGRGDPLGEPQMVKADDTMHGRIVEAVKEDLVDQLQKKITEFTPVAAGLPNLSRVGSDITFRVGDIEDANVLVQNSLWLNVPLAKLGDHQQVTSLQNRRQWAQNQREQIDLIGSKFDQLAENLERLCI